jgi:predicted dehydrogenase
MAKIGLIGCGVVAMYGHLPAIKKTPGLELHSLFDVSPAALDAAQRQFQPQHTFTDIDAFFNSGIDAVVVTSPAPIHLSNVIDCARYGKHVLCEKPLAMNEAEIVRMIEAMEKAQRMFFTGFTYRFSPASLKIKELVTAGAIGQVRSTRLIYVWNLHGKWSIDPVTGQKIETPRRVGRMLEGGPMVDCGVHQIDLARWWLDSEVVRARGVGAWVDRYEAPDHMYLHMDHASGAHSTVEISFTYGYTVDHPAMLFTYDLIGTDGIIRYHRDASLFELHNDRGRQSLPYYPEKGFEPMYAAFAEALRTGQPGNLPSGRDGLAATRIAREATEQAIRDRFKA